VSAAVLRTLAVRRVTGEHDLPADRYNDHVNNARYFAFVNDAFQHWYVAMGVRGGMPERGMMMAHQELDFLSEIRPPAVVEVRIAVSRVGRTSMDHAIEIHDLGVGAQGPARQAARGRAVHVWVDRATRQPTPWPVELLSKCWDG
jgi:acyl-CoA thioester hydrolase